jgi:hypothetical protein
VRASRAPLRSSIGAERRLRYARRTW